MSTIVGPAIAAQARRFALSADLVAPALLSLAFAGLALVTWGTWGDLGADTGYDELAAARIAGGELPYVDFTYFYGPLGIGALGLLFALFGSSVGVAVAFGLMLAFAIVVATYALARTQVGPWGSFLAGALTAPVALGPTNFSYVTPHSYSAPLGILLTLALLLAVARVAAGGSSAWLVAAGALLGLTTLTRPEFVLAAVLGTVLWLGLRRRAGIAGSNEVVRVVIPAAAVATVVYGVFALLTSPGELLFGNLYPLDELRAGASDVLSIHAPMTASSFVELALRLLLYAVSAAGLVVAARLVERHGRIATALRFAAAGGFALALVAAAARPEALRHGLQYAYGWIPAGAAVAVAVLLLRRRRQGDWSARDQVALASAVVLAVLAAKTYGAFFVLAPFAQPAVYALPFAALLLVRLHLRELAPVRTAAVFGAAWLGFLALASAGLTLKDARAESVSVRGPGGALAEQPAEAAALSGALDVIAAESEPGDTILVGPQLTSLYLLAERSNPLRQLSLIPNALPTRADERAAIAELDASGTRLIVLDRRSFPAYGHTSFGSSFDRQLAAWIERNFVRVNTLGAGSPRVLDVWIRRQS